MLAHETNMDLQKQLQANTRTSLKKLDQAHRDDLLRNIAGSLSRIPRYHTGLQTFYSVAQHCILVSDILLYQHQNYDLALNGLLHRSHDAFIGPISELVQAELNNTVGWDAIATIKDAADDVIYNILHIHWPPSDMTTTCLIRAIQRAASTEKRDILDVSVTRDERAKPFNKAIRPMPWPKAEEEFLKQFDKLQSMSAGGV